MASRPTGVLIAVQLALVLSIAGIAAIVQLETLPAQVLIYPLSVLMLGMFVWQIWSWRLATGRWFDPYSIFLIDAMLFNTGEALLNVFGLNPFGFLDGKFDFGIQYETLIVVSLGLSLFHLGALIAVRVRDSLRRRANATAPRRRIWPEPSERDLRLLGWALIVVALPFTLGQIKGALDVVLSSGYYALYQQTGHTGFDAGPKLLAGFLIPGALLLLAGSKDSRLGQAVSAALTVGYALTQLFLGYRYYAAIPLIGYAWLWNRSVRRLPRLLLVGSGCVLLFVVFPLVHATRDTPGADRLSLLFLIQAYTSLNNPIVSIVHEMGLSMWTVAYTIQLVPSVRHFDLGVSYFYGLTTIFPSLFWSVHPAQAHGSLTDWLVQSVDPARARSGGSLAYTYVAEAFINFGLVGGSLTLGMFGYLYARFSLWGSDTTDRAKMATVAAACVAFTIFARGESAIAFRALAWYALVPYALVLALAWLRSPRQLGWRPPAVLPARTEPTGSTPFREGA